MKITPVLFVEEIEKSLRFWVDRIGFEKTVEVPGEDGLAFVILVHEGVELMLQSLASVRRDEPKFAPGGAANGASLFHGSSLFMEVADFDDMLKRLEGYPIEMAERTTNYGMREIGGQRRGRAHCDVRDADGTVRCGGEAYRRVCSSNNASASMAAAGPADRASSSIFCAAPSICSGT